jgi:hypothetical protein
MAPGQSENVFDLHGVSDTAIFPKHGETSTLRLGFRRLPFPHPQFHSSPDDAARIEPSQTAAQMLHQARLES